MGDLTACGEDAVSKIRAERWSFAVQPWGHDDKGPQWLGSICQGLGDTGRRIGIHLSSLGCRPTWHSARSAGQLAQLSKWELRCMLTPRSFFDVQHGIINLESIRAHDLLMYSWNESWSICTTLKNRFKIHEDMLAMQPGNDGYCICAHYTNKFFLWFTSARTRKSYPLFKAFLLDS